MRLTTNEKLVERQSKIARYATFAGLAILLGSLIASFNSNTVPLPVAYALLFAGFLLAYVGAVLANKYVKEPRADHALEKALKGFDNKNHLYNFLLPSPHVLLTPTGVLVFRVKAQDGPISCHGDKWRRPFRVAQLIGGLGQESLGNPSAELRDEIAKVKKWLAGKIEDAALVPVDGYVVFTDERAVLELDEPTTPVVRAAELKDVLRKGKRGAPFAPELYERVAKAMDDTSDGKAT
jgi:hypothetical protein